jgi:TATA-binding protein-associated factor Taf7
MVIPTAVVDAPPTPPATPADDDAPVLDAKDEPGDFGDDSSSDEDNSSSNEDENGNDEEDEDVDIVGMEDDNSVVANNGNDNNNINNNNNNDNNDNNSNNDNNNDNDGDQGNENQYRRAEDHMHTYIAVDGQFRDLLEELLQELDHTVRLSMSLSTMWSLA